MNAEDNEAIPQSSSYPQLENTNNMIEFKFKFMSGIVKSCWITQEQKDSQNVSFIKEKAFSEEYNTAEVKFVRQGKLLKNEEMLRDLDLSHNQFIHVIIPRIKEESASTSAQSDAQPSGPAGAPSDNQSESSSNWDPDGLNSLDRVLAQIRAQTERRYERARLGLPEEDDPDILADDDENQARQPNPSSVRLAARLMERRGQRIRRIGGLPIFLNNENGLFAIQPGVAQNQSRRRGNQRSRVLRRIFVNFPRRDQQQDGPDFNERYNGQDRPGNILETVMGVIIGCILGPWSFICLLTRCSSRRLRVGIYFGFLFWILQRMNDADAAQKKQKKQKQQELKKRIEQHQHLIDNMAKDSEPASSLNNSTLNVGSLSEDSQNQKLPEDTDILNDNNQLSINEQDRWVFSSNIRSLLNPKHIIQMQERAKYDQQTQSRRYKYANTINRGQYSANDVLFQFESYILKKELNDISNNNQGKNTAQVLTHEVGPMLVDPVEPAEPGIGFPEEFKQFINKDTAKSNSDSLNYNTENSDNADKP